MEFIKQFISEYGAAILYAVLTALAGWVGIWAKSLYTKHINDKTKKAVAKTVVLAIEQLYRDLDGEAKLEKALEAASDMLAEKGITITALELRMLIEAAVAEFNDAFHREKMVESDLDNAESELDNTESDLDNTNVDLDNAEQMQYSICDDDGCGINYPDTILSVDELCGVQDACDDSTASDEEDTSANEGLSEFGDYDS